MKEMTMLDLDAIDLDVLSMALEDHSYESSWWFDPTNGEIRLHDPGALDDVDDDLEEAGLVPIEPLPSSVGYRDMADFVEAVPDRRVAAMLAHAIEGRGAFRRFKDALFELPELRQQWFAFRDARMRRHVIGWLEDQELIDHETARNAAAEYRDPPVGAAVDSLPGLVAADLRAMYGDRLVDVYVFGSRARDDYDEDSDLDLLVVLDDMESEWQELGRVDELLWEHTKRSGVAVVALPVTAERFAHPDEPWIIRAKIEGRRAA